MSYPLTRPFEQYGDTDHGAAVIVAAVLGLITAAMFVIVRVIISRAYDRDRNAIHAVSLLATGLAIIQTALLIQAVQFGLGRHRNDLQTWQFLRYSKYNYASQILAISVMASTKASMLFFLLALTGQTEFIRICKAILAVIMVWFVFSILTLAFECGFPDPWICSRDRFVGGGTLVYIVAGGNIVTDLLLTFTPLPMIWGLQMSKVKRVVICLLLSSRFSVVLVSAIDLKYLSVYVQSTDPSWAGVSNAILLQIMMNLSIIVTTIPFIHRMLANLHTGVLGTLLITDQMELSHIGALSGGSKSKTFRSLGKGSKASYGRSSDGPGNSNVSDTEKLGALRPPPVAEIWNDIRHVRRERGITSDSTEELNTSDGIVHTTEFEVTHEC